MIMVRDKKKKKLKKKKTNKENVKQLTRGDIVSCLFFDSGRSERSQSFFSARTLQAVQVSCILAGAALQRYIYFWGTRCVLFDLKRRFEFFKLKHL